MLLRHAGLDARVLPQSGLEADLANELVRPRPTSHAADRLQQAMRPLETVDPGPQPAPAEVLEVTLDADATDIKWPQMVALAKEAVDLFQHRRCVAKASRWEELVSFWAQVIGLDLAECRLHWRQRGTVDLDTSLYSILSVRFTATLADLWKLSEGPHKWLMSEEPPWLAGIDLQPCSKHHEAVLAKGDADHGMAAV